MERRRFGVEEQERFAQWSGDRNPMHMDALAARRTVAGVPVVHGVHAVLWLLDGVARGCGGRRAAGLEVRFLRFVPVGAEVERVVVREGPEGVEAVVRREGVVALTLAVRWAGAAGAAVETGGGVVVGPGEAAASAPEWEGLAGLRGRVAVAGAGEAEAAYPGAAALLPPGWVAGLLAMSRLVGMVCPGLHSVFTGFSVAVGEAGEGLGFAVAALDARFRLVTLAVAGCGLAGTVTAAMRPAPVEQPGIEALRAVVRPGEFRGTVALVLGGSRGLGELTAKLLAAGGGGSLLTYAAGAEDAGRVVDAVRSAGVACRAMRVDAGVGLAGQLGGALEGVTQAYHFASPKIFRQGSAVFDAAAFREFGRFYVEAFAELCGLFRGREVAVFYPSSVAVETRPRGMTEYAMAKAAGEALCADLGRWSPGVRIVLRRLPRLLTDQTATSGPVRSGDAVAVMAEVVRAMRG